MLETFSSRHSEARIELKHAFEQVDQALILERREFYSDEIEALTWIAKTAPVANILARDLLSNESQIILVLAA